jgi:hypothetical protein
MMKRWILAVAVVCLAGIPCASADLIYVGASGGQTTLEFDDMSLNFDGDDTAFKGSKPRISTSGPPRTRAGA